MEPIAATTNPFGGILPKPGALNADAQAFAEELRVSLAVWKEEGYKVAWLEVTIDKAALIPQAVAVGFVFHHSGAGYLMLTLQLQEGAFVPAYASHYIGAGGVVLNEDQELLVVSEKHHRSDGSPPRYKLPGGQLIAGEHLAEAVVREVFEETSIIVKNVQYFSSQAWPFPNSLMLGFRAEYESGEIIIDGRRANALAPQDLPVHGQQRRGVHVATEHTRVHKLQVWFLLAGAP